MNQNLDNKIKLIILIKALLTRAFSPYGLTKLELKFFYFAIRGKMNKYCFFRAENADSASLEEFNK